jgi:hypothetical protein
MNISRVARLPKSEKSTFSGGRGIEGKICSKLYINIMMQRLPHGRGNVGLTDALFIILNIIFTWNNTVNILLCY